ncbi:P-type DNA transfer ATPase VirB11 [[Empedobacter] haloabium]|uniref:Type IV secretion system protein n=1 Tax=[Empedobacter] haloabium TaxID=592317 RepID=A0ABZ1UM81_9BURK
MNAPEHSLRRPRTDGGDNPDMLYAYMAPLRPWLLEDGITELVINRPGEVWVERRSGWEVYDAPEMTFAACMQLARLIANFNGKAISAEKPVLSASLIYGERAQVVIPPACEDGTVSLTIRKPSVLDKTLDELNAEGSFDECKLVSEGLAPFERELLALKENRRIKEFLDLAVRKRRNILVVGKTGSGKTTLSKSLIRSIPADERLITIEDVHEMFLQHHPNKVHLFYSREDEGGAKVSPKQALASCLRMKPDRILLAELRGDEAWEFIKSINTGHPGSISTMHANGAMEAFEQLTALIKDSRTGAHLDSDYIKHRLFTTLDVILFYDKYKLKEIYYDPEFKRQQMA